MSATAPGKWRQQRACARCRRLKVRCAYDDPSFSSCIRCYQAGEPCLFNPNQQPRHFDDPDSSTPQSATSGTSPNTSRITKPRAPRRRASVSATPQIYPSPHSAGRRFSFVVHNQASIQAATGKNSIKPADFPAITPTPTSNTSNSNTNNLQDALDQLNKLVTRLQNSTSSHGNPDAESSLYALRRRLIAAQNSLTQLLTCWPSGGSAGPVSTVPSSNDLTGATSLAGGSPAASASASEFSVSHILSDDYARHLYHKFTTEILPAWPAVILPPDARTYNALSRRYPLLLLAILTASVSHIPDLHATLRHKLETGVAHRTAVYGEVSAELLQIHLLMSLWILPRSSHSENHLMHLLTGSSMAWVLSGGGVTSARTALEAHCCLASLALHVPKYRELVTWPSELQQASDLLSGLPSAEPHDRFLIWHSTLLRIGHQILRQPLPLSIASFEAQLSSAVAQFRGLDTGQPLRRLLDIVYFQILIYLYGRVLGGGAVPDTPAGRQIAGKLAKSAKRLLRRFRELAGVTAGFPVHFYFRPIHAIVVLTRLEARLAGFERTEGSHKGHKRYSSHSSHDSHSSQRTSGSDSFSHSTSDTESTNSAEDIPDLDINVAFHYTELLQIFTNLAQRSIVARRFLRLLRRVGRGVLPEPQAELSLAKVLAEMHEETAESEESDGSERISVTPPKTSDIPMIQNQQFQSHQPHQPQTSHVTPEPVGTQFRFGINRNPGNPGNAGSSMHHSHQQSISAILPEYSLPDSPGTSLEALRTATTADDTSGSSLGSEKSTGEPVRYFPERDRAAEGLHEGLEMEMSTNVAQRGYQRNLRGQPRSSVAQYVPKEREVAQQLQRSTGEGGSSKVEQALRDIFSEIDDEVFESITSYYENQG